MTQTHREEDENDLLFGTMANRREDMLIDRLFLFAVQANLHAELTGDALSKGLACMIMNEKIDEEWRVHLESTGFILAREKDCVSLDDAQPVCLWDGERARPANKDSYSHFIVNNPKTRKQFFVPKELAFKILALGYIP